MAQRTFTLPQFQVYLNQLPKKLQKSSQEINMEMAKSLEMGIKLGINPTGGFSTGHFKEQVKVLPKGDNTLQIVGPRYWKYLNLGVGPKTPIPIEFLEQHMGNPGVKGQWVDNVTAWVTPDFTQHRGFVDRAITNLDKKAVNIINKFIVEAFQ
jgi:hypothetical protein